MGTTPEEPTVLRAPEGSTLALERVLAVATVTNAAHRSMGTELVALERHGATIAVGWREDLVEVPGGGLATGVVAAMLDHACALAALMSVDDETRCGATMGLRVDHLSPTRPGLGLKVAARCLHRSAQVAFVRADAHHLGDLATVVATGTATVSVRP